MSQLPESEPSVMPNRLPETHRERMIRLAVQLQVHGVSSQLLSELLSYDLDLIEQQLIWLPARKARKKASMIVSAIRYNCRERSKSAPAG